MTNFVEFQRKLDRDLKYKTINVSTPEGSKKRRKVPLKNSPRQAKHLQSLNRYSAILKERGRDAPFTFNNGLD